MARLMAARHFCSAGRDLRHSTTLLIVTAMLFTASTRSKAQTVPDPYAGIQMFSTNDFGIDLASSAVNLKVPLRSKSGAIPFFSYLFGTSQAFQSTAAGSPVIYTNLGLTYFDPTATTIIELPESSGNCTGGGTYTIYGNFSINDFTGAGHALPPTFTWKLSATAGCGTSPAQVNTTDGSGYTFVPGSSGSFTIYDRSGMKWSGRCASGAGCSVTPTITDPDNNSISTSGGYSGYGTVTDTLNTVVLKANLSNGSISSYSYADPKSVTQNYNLGYTSNDNAKTNFFCPNWADSTVNGYAFLTSISLPGGGQYTIAYEPTPNGNGFTNNGHYFTGRIAQITYPSGGSISYTYSGGNNGFDCNSQVVPQITVKVKDNHGNLIGTYNYYNNNTVAGLNAFEVVRTDAQGNQTLYNFVGEFQTNAAVYKLGCPQSLNTNCNGGGTLLMTTKTCYNQQPCSPSSVTLPITQTDVYTSLGTSNTNHVQTTFDPVYGNLLTRTAYDYGASTFTLQTSINYGSYSGGACVQIGNNIYDKPCSIQVSNPSATIAGIAYTYTSKGHPTASQQSISGSSYRRMAWTYNTNGTVATATDSDNQATTNYYYNGTGGCNSLLPTSVTYPKVGSVQLSTSETWDCNGAVPLSVTDVNNNQPTYYDYYNPSTGTADPLWRLVYTKRPDGGTTTNSYATGAPPWSTTVTTSIGNGSNAQTEVIYDAFARPINNITFDPEGNDEVDTTYDSLGRVSSVTTPYRGSSISATTYQYDALNRIAQVTNPDGTYRTFQWTNRADLITDELGNQIVEQNDGLGRLQYVCSGINAPQQANNDQATTCAHIDISEKGFLATYGYNALNNLTSVSYANESRTYTYDGLSRLITSRDPESGTIQYTYDTQVVGDLYAKTLQSGKYVGYSHDVLHRLTGKAYSDSTPTANYYYDQINVQGIPIANGYGRLTSAQLTTSSGAVVGSAFSYDGMGRVTGEWSCTPLRCPSASSLNPIQLQFSWDQLGDLTSLINQSDNSTWSSGVSWTYNYDATPNLTSITTNAVTTYSPGTLISQMTYGPAGNLLSAVTGDGVSRTYGYDKAFRLNSINLAGGPMGSGQNWAAQYFGNGSAETSADPINGSWSYSYDVFNRVKAANCSGSCPYSNTTQGITFTYDEYGNRWTQTVQGTGINPSYSFNLNNQISGLSYDVDGNLENDGIGDTFTYDPDGRVTSSVEGAGSATFVYDPFGNRAEEVINSAQTVDYVYDPSGRLITEADLGCDSGSPYYPCTDFVYVGGSVVPFSQFSDPLCCTAYATFNYYDYMGSLRETTAGGAINGSYQNDPYGDDSSSAPQPSWFGFAALLGSYVQTSSTRAYHQTEGRWITPDPAGLSAVNVANPQTLNRYGYTANNPVSAADASGLGPPICQGGYYPCALGSGGTGAIGTGVSVNPWTGNCAAVIDSGNLCFNPVGWNSLDWASIPVYGNPLFGSNQEIKPATEVASIIDYGTLNPSFDVATLAYTPNEVVDNSWSETLIGTGLQLQGATGVYNGPDPVEVQGRIRSVVITQLKSIPKVVAKEYFCGSSPADNIKNWTLEGAGKGFVFGTVAGGITGTIFGTPVGGFAGAIAGGVVEGTLGAGAGVFGGSAASLVCSGLGAY